jgi:agmatine deiminase
VTPQPSLYRRRAEWEPHAATWLAWPHNTSDWPGKFHPIPWVYGEIIRTIVPGELVHLIVESKKHEAAVRSVLTRVGVDIERVQLHRFPTNRCWTRDIGPLFVIGEDSHPALTTMQFRFNAWSKYLDWAKDARIPSKISAELDIPVVIPKHKASPIVLEGGAIDTNGEGTLLTTEECLLDPEQQVRNPGFGKKDYEELFSEYLGTTNVLWLGRGIAGDDTHGHIDDLCRFVSRSTVVLCQEPDSRDANYAPLQENRERLEGVVLPTGEKLEVVPLPMPAPVVFEGQRLPASYANFYFTNAAVLVPTFNDPNDRIALGVLSELIKDRPVVGIHAVDLVWGLGTIHCLSHEQPLV